MEQGLAVLTEPISKNQLLQARLAIGLVVGLIVLGVVCYGFATETLDRVWANLLARPSGPMTFRFVLQPAMAAIAALRDGIKDARLGRRPYLWAILTGVRGPEGRSGRLWEGIATARSDSRRHHGCDLSVGRLENVLSSGVGDHRGLARVRSLCFAAWPLRARRAPLGRQTRIQLSRPDDGEPRSQVRRQH